VLGKISESAARRYFLTAETMSAGTLKEIGLAHEVVAADALDVACRARFGRHLERSTGRLKPKPRGSFADVAHQSVQERADTSIRMAARLARLRVAEEAQEGFSAFFAKRKANWRED